MKTERKVQYLCAVLLILSSIALAFYQVFDISDIRTGVLMYIAQAFLLVGSIFGLEYYLSKLRTFYENKSNSQGNKEQQST